MSVVAERRPCHSPAGIPVIIATALTVLMQCDEAQALA